MALRSDGAAMLVGGFDGEYRNDVPLLVLPALRINCRDQGFFFDKFWQEVDES